MKSGGIAPLQEVCIAAGPGAPRKPAKRLPVLPVVAAKHWRRLPLCETAYFFGMPAVILTLTCMLLLALAALPVYGQAFGAVGGDVTDPSGAVVPSAKVTATEAETGFERSAVSDASCHYVISTLRPTQYTLKVEAKGFRTFIRQGIVPPR